MAVYVYVVPDIVFIGDTPEEIAQSLAAYRDGGVHVPPPLEAIARWESVTAEVGVAPFMRMQPTDDVRVRLAMDQYADFRRYVPEMLADRSGPLCYLTSGPGGVVLVPERVVRGIQGLDWDAVECANLVPPGYYVKTRDWNKQH